MQSQAFSMDEVRDDAGYRRLVNDREGMLSWAGICSWRAFHAAGLSMDVVFEAAQKWKAQLEGIEKPWLVWSIDEDWCYVQQKLVLEAGWTPVIGYDPRGGIPSKIVDEAILIDFNCFKLPVLYMHFPLEFAFLFAPRLAFWHADLLCVPEQMHHLSDIFSSLKDGQMAIVKPKLSFLYQLRNRSKRRFWELAGCVTKDASEDMYNKGCGFWYNWAFHPNCPDRKEFLKRNKRYWDHGAGLLYWYERYKTDVYKIDEGYLDAGHFSRIAKKEFKSVSPENELRNAAVDLANNYTLESAAASIGLDLEKL